MGRKTKDCLKTPLQQLLKGTNSTGHAKAIALTATRIMLAHNKARALKSNMVKHTLVKYLRTPTTRGHSVIYHYAGVDKQVCLREKCSMQRHNTNTWRGINHSTEQLWARRAKTARGNKTSKKSPPQR